MEIEIIGHEGAKPDSLVMIQAGHIRRQIKLSTGLPFQFPTLPVNANPFKVEIYQPECSKSVMFSPDADHYVVKMPPVLNGTPHAELRLRITNANAPQSSLAGFESIQQTSTGQIAGPTGEADTGGWSEIGGSDATHQDRKVELVANARAYLTQNNLLNFVQEMLAQVIKEKPEDPYGFMGGYAQEQLQAARKSGI